MKISYHKWKDFDECPKKFCLKHKFHRPPTVKVNEYFTLYGRLMESFWTFYANLWRFKTPFLFKEIIRERMEKLFEGILLTSDVNWSALGCSKTREQILDEAVEHSDAIMHAPTLNLFLSSQSEIPIAIQLSNGHTLTGRLDFVHTYPSDKSVLIFDGKGAGTKGKYISEDQLYFYAMLYLLHFKKLPDKLGFFYYRFNELVEVPLSMETLNEFRARLSLAVKAIDAGRAEATPSARACKYCDYFNSCQEGTESAVGRKRKSKLDGELEQGDGVVSFGF